MLQGHPREAIVSIIGIGGMMSAGSLPVDMDGVTRSDGVRRRIRVVDMLYGGVGSTELFAGSHG